jgi:hypothetical protein
MQTVYFITQGVILFYLHKIYHAISSYNALPTAITNINATFYLNAFEVYIPGNNKVFMTMQFI